MKHPLFLSLLAALLLAGLVAACDDDPKTSKNVGDTSVLDTSTDAEETSVADTEGDTEGDTAEDSTDLPDTAEVVVVTPEDLPFPESFLFGAAVAGFQVDMGCPTLPAAECEDRNSDWYEYIVSDTILQDPLTHLSGDPPSSGPGHWELYESDLDGLQNEVHGGAFRMSLEWSRIFPTATDSAATFAEIDALADQAALDHYHAIFTSLRSRGIEPLVTLNHYTLPPWIHDAVGCHVDLANCSPRGWLDTDRTLTEIAKYAGFVAQEFGGEVDLWATLNEPFAVMLPGYLLPTADRTNPPCVASRAIEAKIVLANLITAHARMYDAVKAADLEDADADGVNSQVGVVYAMAPVAPMDPSDPTDVQAADNVFYLWNTLYLDAVVLGEFDADADRNPVHREDLANRMDYLGINYYLRATVEDFGAPFLPELSPLTDFNPLTVNFAELYPRGIYEVVMHASERYHVPILITENGLALEGDGSGAVGFLVQHLTWVARAIRDGADVRGYFYWSLMDNYEWNHGMGMRFGLFEVGADAAKTRTARPAVATYRTIIDAGEVPQALQESYPAP